jgi:hypothetical protein
LNPEFFQLSADYRLTIRFVELPPAPNDASIQVTVKAVDARGRSVESTYPRKPAPGGRAPAKK